MEQNCNVIVGARKYHACVRACVRARVCVILFGFSNNIKMSYMIIHIHVCLVQKLSIFTYIYMNCGEICI